MSNDGTASPRGAGTQGGFDLAEVDAVTMVTCLASDNSGPVGGTSEVAGAANSIRGSRVA
jgi:hypothetical protein